MTARRIVIVALTLAGCSSTSRPHERDQPRRPTLGAPIDRAGRPLTANSLLGPIAADEIGDRLKERFNRATPATGAQFLPDIVESLGLFDGLDGICGNQWLANPSVAPSLRYRTLAITLADDRLWVNSASRVCTQYLAVEFAALAGDTAARSDCGGRMLSYDASNVFRSVLAVGKRTGIDDGLTRDDREHSATEFPFVAAP